MLTKKFKDSFTDFRRVVFCVKADCSFALGWIKRCVTTEGLVAKNLGPKMNQVM